MPQVEYVDEDVEVPVTKQVRVPMIQKVQKIVKVPQIQFHGRPSCWREQLLRYEDQIVEVPVAKQVNVPMIEKVQKIAPRRSDSVKSCGPRWRCPSSSMRIRSSRCPLPSKCRCP